MKRIEIFRRLIQLSYGDEHGTLVFDPVEGTVSITFNSGKLEYETVVLRKVGSSYYMCYMTRQLFKRFKLREEEYILLKNLFKIH